MSENIKYLRELVKLSYARIMIDYTGLFQVLITITNAQNIYSKEKHQKIPKLNLCIRVLITLGKSNIETEGNWK